MWFSVILSLLVSFSVQARDPDAVIQSFLLQRPELRVSPGELVARGRRGILSYSNSPSAPLRSMREANDRVERIAQRFARAVRWMKNAESEDAGEYGFSERKVLRPYDVMLRELLMMNRMLGVLESMELEFHQSPAVVALGVGASATVTAMLLALNGLDTGELPERTKEAISILAGISVLSGGIGGSLIAWGPDLLAKFRGLIISRRVHLFTTLFWQAVADAGLNVPLQPEARHVWLTRLLQGDVSHIDVDTPVCELAIRVKKGAL